jgi:hypothetical protein
LATSRILPSRSCSSSVGGRSTKSMPWNDRLHALSRDVEDDVR